MVNQLFNQISPHDHESANRSLLSDTTRRRLTHLSSGVAITLCLSLIATGKASAISFTFTKIADTQSGFSDLGRGIDLNDQGVVSFAGTQAAGRSIFTGNGTTINTVIDTADLPALFPPESLPFNPIGISYLLGENTAINNDNTVLFTANQNVEFSQEGSPYQTQGLFKSQDGAFSQIGPFQTSFSLGSITVNQNYVDFDLNDSNEVVSSTLGTFRNFISTAIQLNGETIDGGIIGAGPESRVFAPTINNQGTAFYARTGPAFGDLTEQQANNIYTFSNGTPATAVNQPTFADTLAANDSGTIVFSGSTLFPNGGTESGIFQVENGVATRIFDQADSVDINNLGTVAFSSANGIFVRSNGGFEQVIAPGSSLLGSTVTNLFFPSAKGLNNNGQLAFFAQLADGTQAIFRADPTTEPTPVPEPASVLGLLTLGGMVSCCLRQKR